MTERMTAAEFAATQTQPKKQKYGAVRKELDGINFDSKHEARCYAGLRQLERLGKIADLQPQVKIPLFGRDGPLRTRTGRHMRLTVDFAYTDLETGLRVYKDAKGTPTRDYEVRRAVAQAQGIEVVEV